MTDHLLVVVLLDKGVRWQENSLDHSATVQVETQDSRRVGGKMRIDGPCKPEFVVGNKKCGISEMTTLNRGCKE